MADEDDVKKFGWGTDEVKLVPSDGSEADPITELQAEMDQIDKLLAEASDEEEE